MSGLAFLDQKGTVFYHHAQIFSWNHQAAYMGYTYTVIFTDNILESVVFMQYFCSYYVAHIA